MTVLRPRPGVITLVAAAAALMGFVLVAAVRADADNVPAKIGMAKTQLFLERAKDAKDLLKKLCETRPNEPLAFFWLGRAEEALGNKKDAETAYANAALKLSGETDDLLRAMARSLLAETDWFAGRLDEAERALAGIVTAWSASDEWLVLQRVGFDLGAVQLEQGRLGAALRTYRTLEARADAAAPELAGMSRVGAAMVHYERDELGEAARQAAVGRLVGSS